MDFQFSEDNELLTKPPPDGLGLTADDIATVEVWQTLDDYEFNFHTGTHGNACVYVKAKGTKGRNYPCIWIEGKDRGSSRDLDSLGKKAKTDAMNVVTSNRELFLKMWTAFNT